MSIDVEQPVEVIPARKPRRKIRIPWPQRPDPASDLLPGRHRPLWDRVARPVTALTIAALVGIPTAMWVDARSTAADLRAGLATLHDLRSQVSQSQPPSDYAAFCLEQWLRAGKDGSPALAATCAPGTTPPSQTPNAVQANARSMPQPFTHETEPGYWSVLLLAETVERVTNPETGVTSYTQLTPTWYRVAIWTDPRNGVPVMRGAPRVVDGPSAPQPPNLAATPDRPDRDDPRTVLLDAYLKAFLVEGSVTNYLAPGIAPRTVHHPNYAAVELTGTDYSPTDDPTVHNALARVAITTTNGNRINAEYPFTLKQATPDLWQITGQPTVPALERK